MYRMYIHKTGNKLFEYLNTNNLGFNLDLDYFDTNLHVVSDETDNQFLELAVEGNAQYIVSVDKHLRRLISYKGIDIVKADIFFELMQDVQ